MAKVTLTMDTEEALDIIHGVIGGLSALSFELDEISCSGKETVSFIQNMKYSLAIALMSLDLDHLEGSLMKGSFGTIIEGSAE